MVATIKAPPVYRIALFQLVAVLLLAAILLIESAVYSYSALLGGVLCIGPSAYFTRFAFKYSGAQATAKVAKAFYLGEAGKFFLTVVLFAIVFMTIQPLSVGILFLSYGIAVIIGIVSAHLIIRR